MTTLTTVLEVRGLQKAFGHVQALRGADLDVMPGEVVGLVGDNGAGKSTLIKIIAGVQHADAGSIRICGEAVSIDSPHTAQALGVETVFQDLALAPDLDVVSNVFLGREIAHSGPLRFLGLLDRSAMRAAADEVLNTLGVNIRDTTAPVAMLSGGQRQSVAVCRAHLWASKVLFLDEPTAALGVQQSQQVLELIRRLRDSGTSVVLVSHNLPQLFQVTDRIEVLRLGRRVAQLVTADTTFEQVIAALTGARESDYEGGRLHG